MVNSADILNAGILIVDDQEANVLLLERMLRGAGHVAISHVLDDPVTLVRRCLETHPTKNSDIATAMYATAQFFL